MRKLICIGLVLVIALAACAGAMGETEAEAAEDYSFHFATTDLDGNAVTSEEIYSGNKITMINFWASWCPPCVGELAELAEVHTQLRELGCGVIGILMDSEDPEGVGKAKALMAEKGTNYPVLALSKDLYGLASVIRNIPTTIFVDSAGTIVGSPIVGAYVEQYVPAVKALL